MLIVLTVEWTYGEVQGPRAAMPGRWTSTPYRRGLENIYFARSTIGFNDGPLSRVYPVWCGQDVSVGVRTVANGWTRKWLPDHRRLPPHRA